MKTPAAIQTQAGQTPGPFEINWGDGRIPTKLVADGVVVAEIAGNQSRHDAGTFSDPKTNANAHLFAAAPELLAQLRNVEEVAAKNAEHGSADWAFIRDTARAAIAKAEGSA